MNTAPLLPDAVYFEDTLRIYPGTVLQRGGKSEKITSTIPHTEREIYEYLRVKCNVTKQPVVNHSKVGKLRKHDLPRSP